MADDIPSTPKQPADGPSELRGLDPGELLARGLQTVRPSVGAGPWEPPTPEEVSRLLPQYRIEALIGRGGMGAVYKAIQLNLDRPVAIKLLPAEMAMDQAFVARFKREARTLAKLQHSRIVTIFDFGRTSEGHLYFVMEYIDGTDLRRVLRGPGLDPEQALALVGQLCDALQAAHREGIVHRDLKPENVLITRDGYVKLADFGLARPSREDGSPNLTQTDMVLGTPDYMAPEQRFGATKADARSDIFALGVMLYEMLTGQTPRGVFDPPSHKAKMDARIDEVVHKALQSEPDRRYQKASELKTAVEKIRTTPLPALAPAAEKSPAAEPKSVSRWPIYVAAACVLFVLGLFGVAKALHGPKTPSALAAAAATPESKLVEKGEPATVSDASAEEFEKIITQHVWFFHGHELRFLPGGVAVHPGFNGGFRWSVDRTVQNNVPTVRLAEQDEVPNRALRSVLWFYKDLSGFTNYEYIDKWEGPGSGGVRLGLRLPFPNELEAATAETNPLAAQVRESVAKAKGLYDGLVGHAWIWTDLGTADPASVVRFLPDGHVTGGWTWELIDKLDGTFMVDCSWGNNNGHQYLVFNPSLESFDSYDSDWNCVVKGQRVKEDEHAPQIAATPAVAPAPAAEPAAPAPAGESTATSVVENSPLYKVLVGNKWAWSRGDGKGGVWRTMLTFHPDGTVTNPTDHHTWFWWVTDDHTAHLQFHRDPPGPPWIPDPQKGMDLNFNIDLTFFRAVYLPDPKEPIASGERKGPVSAPPSMSLAAQPAPPAPTPVLTAASSTAEPEAVGLAAITITTPDNLQIIPLKVGMPRLHDSNPLRVIETVRADLNGAKFTSIPQRIDNQYVIHVDKPGVLYVFGGKANTQPTRQEFMGIDDPRWAQDNDAIMGKNLVACFRRHVSAGETISLHGFELELAAGSIAMAALQPDAAPANTGTVANLEKGASPSNNPAVASPAARHAAKVYDAIVGYHWAWINTGETKPPLVVEFTWDGHCTGGWTWKPVYKPDGETLIDCAWGDNGHQYLRLNEACDAFESFNSQGQFNVSGKRLGPIGQPVSAEGAALVAATGVKTPPSKQIEPLLEPCLNAILAPLQENPQMPRVAVDKLRAVLGGDAVKAKTPLEKQIYQYAAAVCESLTNGMDERALTKAAALSSSWVPSLSNGGSIINTMPLRGWDAGHAGDAIRKKQNDERRYADKRADQYSIFMESAAYKAWIAKAANLRQNVMALYGRLVQLEATEPAPEAGSR